MLTAEQEKTLEKAKMYKALTGTPIDDDIIEAFESALTELSAIKQRAEDIMLTFAIQDSHLIHKNDVQDLIDYIIKGETK